MPKTATARTSDAAIFAHLWETGNGGLTPTLARPIVKLGFPKEDQARMHELAVKNQEGRLSPQESDELDNYIRVGDLLAILQSKARKFLQQRG